MVEGIKPYCYQNILKVDFKTLSSSVSRAKLMRPYKAETAVHGCWLLSSISMFFFVRNRVLALVPQSSWCACLHFVVSSLHLTTRQFSITLIFMSKTGAHLIGVPGLRNGCWVFKRNKIKLLEWIRPCC